MCWCFKHISCDVGLCRNILKKEFAKVQVGRVLHSENDVGPFQRNSCLLTVWTASKTTSIPSPKKQHLAQAVAKLYNLSWSIWLMNRPITAITAVQHVLDWQWWSWIHCSQCYDHNVVHFYGVMWLCATCASYCLYEQVLKIVPYFPSASHERNRPDVRVSICLCCIGVCMGTTCFCSVCVCKVHRQKSLGHVSVHIYIP